MTERKSGWYRVRRKDTINDDWQFAFYMGSGFWSISGNTEVKSDSDFSEIHPERIDPKPDKTK